MKYRNVSFYFFSILFTCFLFISTNSISQEDKTISVSKLQKDLDQLEEFLETHPDPYTHISEKKLHASIEEIRIGITDPMTLIEFYKKIKPIITSIKDGHSNMYLPQKWFKNKKKENGVFPYKMYLSDEDELYVLKSYNKGTIPNGSKIISINGVSIDSFLTIVDPYVSYEKKIFRNTVIDGNFDFYLYLAFGDLVNTTLQYEMFKPEEVTVQNMSYKLWKKALEKDMTNREKKIDIGKPYDYKKLDNGVGIITIYSFLVVDISAYKLFLGRTFKSIRKDNIHSLIVDVRGNFGGWPKVSSLLFHYISNSNFKTMAKTSVKVSKPYKRLINKDKPSWVNSVNFNPKRTRYTIDINGILYNPVDSYINEESFYNEAPEIRNYEFVGDCYLLMNRDSYSPASSFAATFQCYQMGTIIGGETGGTKIFRANKIVEKLKKSNILCSISTTKNYTTCYSEEFEGVVPDVKVIPSVLDRVHGVDSELNLTLRLIDKVQNN